MSTTITRKGAARLSALGGAGSQPHFTQLDGPRQDPSVVRLQQMAAAARMCGDEEMGTS